MFKHPSSARFIDIFDKIIRRRQVVTATNCCLGYGPSSIKIATANQEVYRFEPPAHCIKTPMPSRFTIPNSNKTWVNATGRLVKEFKDIRNRAHFSRLTRGSYKEDVKLLTSARYFNTNCRREITGISCRRFKQDLNRKNDSVAKYIRRRS